MVLVFEVCVVVMLLSVVLVFGLIGKNSLVFFSVLFNCLWVMLVCIVVLLFLVWMIRILFMFERLREILFKGVSICFLMELLMLKGIIGMLCLVYSLMVNMMLLVFLVSMMLLGVSGWWIDLLWLCCSWVDLLWEKCCWKCWVRVSESVLGRWVFIMGEIGWFGWDWNEYVFDRVLWWIFFRLGWVFWCESCCSVCYLDWCFEWFEW